MTVITRGDKELSLRFETFPAKVREKLKGRIRDVTERLAARIRAATPVKTGKLRSEETVEIYSDSPDRIAGYVSVFAPSGSSNEYAKAATLEYGTDKPRRHKDRSSIMSRLAGRPRRRILVAVSKPVHIEAFMYLRGPLAEMSPEIRAELDEAIEEAVVEGEA